MAPGSLFRMGFSAPTLRLETIDCGTFEGFRTSRALAPRGEAPLRQRDRLGFSKSLERLRKLPIDGVR
jgi:hypothetical protein